MAQSIDPEASFRDLYSHSGVCTQSYSVIPACVSYFCDIMIGGLITLTMDHGENYRK